MIESVFRPSPRGRPGKPGNGGAVKRERTGIRVPSITLAFLVVCTFLLASPSIAFSQSPGDDPPKKIDDIKHDTPGVAIKPNRQIRSNVNLALVNVTVTDPYNRLVMGLESDNFRVFEDNIEQEIVTFSSEDVPISVGVILDLSGSMANKLGKVKQAALQFLSTANPEDEFFLVGFNERAQVLSPFTSNVEDIQSRMLSASAKGKTALLD